MSLRGTPAGGPKPFGLELTAERQSHKTSKTKGLPSYVRRLAMSEKGLRNNLNAARPPLVALMIPFVANCCIKVNFM